MTKYTTPAVPLTDYEREIVTILMEECAEVTQRASKMIRFGANEVQAGQFANNIERLSEELGNLMEMVNVVYDAGLLDSAWVEHGRANKQRKLPQYLQSSPPA